MDQLIFLSYESRTARMSRACIFIFNTARDFSEHGYIHTLVRIVYSYINLALNAVLEFVFVIGRDF